MQTYLREARNKASNQNSGTTFYLTNFHFTFTREKVTSLSGRLRWLARLPNIWWRSLTFMCFEVATGGAATISKIMKSIVTVLNNFLAIYSIYYIVWSHLRGLENCKKGNWAKIKKCSIKFFVLPQMCFIFSKVKGHLGLVNGVWSMTPALGDQSTPCNNKGWAAEKSGLASE